MIILPRLGADPDPTRGRPPWLQAFPFPVGRSLVVALSGEADLSTADQLRDQLTCVIALDPAELVIDVTDLTFCDTAGLSVLQGAVTEARGRGVPLVYRGMSERLLWLTQAFPVGAGAAVDLPRQAPVVEHSSR